MGNSSCYRRITDPGEQFIDKILKNLKSTPFEEAKEEFTKLLSDESNKLEKEKFTNLYVSKVLFKEETVSCERFYIHKFIERQLEKIEGEFLTWEEVALSFFPFFTFPEKNSMNFFYSLINEDSFTIDTLQVKLKLFIAANTTELTLSVSENLRNSDSEKRELLDNLLLNIYTEENTNNFVNFLLQGKNLKNTENIGLKNFIEHFGNRCKLLDKIRFLRFEYVNKYAPKI